MAPKNNNAAVGEINFGLLPNLIGYHLRRTQSAVFRHFMQTVGDHDITPGHFGILVLIDANPGLSQSMLAAALNVDRSSIVPAIDHLEGRNLVVREKKPGDRRTYELRLTKEGERIFAMLTKAVYEHEETVAKNLTPEERNQLITLLKKIRPVVE